MKNKREKTNRINVAIVGPGNYARVIISKLIVSEYYKISWCVHYQKERAEQFAATYNCTGCDDLELPLTDPSVDAVFIMTPHDSHFELAKRALQANKHVFIEKPMTNTVQEANELGKMISKQNIIFMVGHNYRRKNGIRFIKQLLENGKLGDPVHFEMVISHGGAFNLDDLSWRNDPQRCLGGPLSILGSHSFEVLQYLLGEPATIYSSNHCSQALSDAVDASVSLLKMKKGATAVLTHYYIVPSLGYLRVEGTEGTATYEIDSNEVILRTGRDINCIPAPTERYTLAALDDRLEQVVEFARAIAGKGEIETDFSTAYPVVKFIEKAMESTLSDKVVTF